MTRLDSSMCRITGAVLTEAAAACPVRMVADPMRRRGREWLRAAEVLEYLAENDDPAEVAFVGSVEDGMEVYTGEDWQPVVRTIIQGTRYALHLEDDSGRARYVNLWGGKTSPVVVRA